MRRIGLLSDTHGYLDDRILAYLGECDEIWHAGDIGNAETAQKLSTLKPFKAVSGNIDGNDLRQEYPVRLRFVCEEVDVLMVHIGGYPGHYSKDIRKEINSLSPKLFISGHSHLLKVIYDKKFQLLHINPGAAGIQGFHQFRTIIRFSIDKSEIKDLEVIELGQKGIIST
ncbi:MAG: metallophosphoesterase family protein [Bacteroidia bacterium]|nr:metallophosphoesterase family protein [Bacteroidia bacterium]